MSPPAGLRPVGERLVESFTRLATLDSPSRREGPVARLLVAELQRLGWDARDDGDGPDCGNVIASLPGDATLEPLLFTSHMDVVMPCLGVRPRLEQGVLRSGGDSVLGADAKASAAALLEVAEVLAATTARRPPLEFLFSWGEEVGHLGRQSTGMVVVRSDDGREAIHPLQKFVRSNQDTCINQRPSVVAGQRVKAGDAWPTAPPPSAANWRWAAISWWPS